MKLIETHLSRIYDLCCKYKVKTLSVFGSVLTDRFNDQSDIDLLVDFLPFDHETEDYVANYFTLRDALQQLLGHRIDLIEAKGLRNKYLLAAINATKHTIYG